MDELTDHLEAILIIIVFNSVQLILIVRSRGLIR